MLSSYWSFRPDECCLLIGPFDPTNAVFWLVLSNVRTTTSKRGPQTPSRDKRNIVTSIFDDSSVSFVRFLSCSFVRFLSLVLFLYNSTHIVHDLSRRQREKKTHEINRIYNSRLYFSPRQKKLIDWLMILYLASVKNIYYLFRLSQFLLTPSRARARRDGSQEYSSILLLIN